MSLLRVDNLKVAVGDKEILHGVSLEIVPRQLRVLIGPNGSGKSSLAQAIIGNKDYNVKNGKIFWGDLDITNLPVYKRARLGLFLAFQHPVEIPGVKLYQFLRIAGQAVSETNGEIGLNFKQFFETAKLELRKVGLSETFLERDLNAGLSGGEKKRSEIFQASVLPIKIAVLDEPDSGLDIDGQKEIAEKISELVRKNIGVLLVTHNLRILNFLKPDKVYVLIAGKIVRVGGRELINEINENGFRGIGVS